MKMTNQDFKDLTPRKSVERVLNQIFSERPIGWWKLDDVGENGLPKTGFRFFIVEDSPVKTEGTCKTCDGDGYLLTSKKLNKMVCHGCGGKGLREYYDGPSSWIVTPRTVVGFILNDPKWEIVIDYCDDGTFFLPSYVYLFTTEQEALEFAKYKNSQKEVK